MILIVHCILGETNMNKAWMERYLRQTKIWLSVRIISYCTSSLQHHHLSKERCAWYWTLIQLHHCMTNRELRTQWDIQLRELTVGSLGACGCPNNPSWNWKIDQADSVPKKQWSHTCKYRIKPNLLCLHHIAVQMQLDCTYLQRCLKWDWL